VWPYARYSCAVRDAVAQSLPVVSNTDEDLLDACEAEALVLEIAVLLVDAYECAIRRNTCDIGVSQESV